MDQCFNPSSGFSLRSTGMPAMTDLSMVSIPQVGSACDRPCAVRDVTPSKFQSLKWVQPAIDPRRYHVHHGQGASFNPSCGFSLRSTAPHRGCSRLNTEFQSLKWVQPAIDGCAAGAVRQTPVSIPQVGSACDRHASRSMRRCPYVFQSLKWVQPAIDRGTAQQCAILAEFQSLKWVQPAIDQLLAPAARLQDLFQSLKWVQPAIDSRPLVCRTDILSCFNPSSGFSLRSTASLLACCELQRSFNPSSGFSLRSTTPLAIGIVLMSCKFQSLEWVQPAIDFGKSPSALQLCSFNPSSGFCLRSTSKSPVSVNMRGSFNPSSGFSLRST